MRPQCQSSVPISMNLIAQLLLFSHTSVNACLAVLTGWVCPTSWRQLAFAFGFNWKNEKNFANIRLVDLSRSLVAKIVKSRLERKISTPFLRSAGELRLMMPPEATFSGQQIRVFQLGCWRNEKTEILIAEDAHAFPLFGSCRPKTNFQLNWHKLVSPKPPKVKFGAQACGHCV